MDGKIHLKQIDDDKIRTKWLNIMGYSIIRFTNDEIKDNLGEVLNTIKSKISELSTSSKEV